MATRRSHRCLISTLSLTSRRIVGTSLVGKLQQRHFATRAFVCFHNASRTARTTRGCYSTLPRSLSTSGGAAAAGTGEGTGATDGGKGGGAGVGGPAVLEGRRRDTGAVTAGVPVRKRRAKQRVDVEFGTFHEFTAVNKHGGKIFEASRELIPAKDAVFFPTVKASNIAEDGSDAVATEVDFLSRVLAGRVTMLGLFHRQFGYSMLPSWTKPFEEAFAQPQWRQEGGRMKAAAPPAAVSLSLLESWPLRMLKPLLVSTMGRGLSAAQKAAFFYRFGPTEEVRKALGIVNRLTLYVLLIDQDGRIRWQATGESTPDELESLIRCARQLAAEGGSSGNAEGGDAVGAGSRAGGGPLERDSRKGSSPGSPRPRSVTSQHQRRAQR